MVASTGFTSSVYAVPFFGMAMPLYIALAALIPNAVVAFVASALLRGIDHGVDETAEGDYLEQRPVVPAPIVPPPAGLRPAH
jgi:hypothetical protein